MPKIAKNCYDIFKSNILCLKIQQVERGMESGQLNIDDYMGLLSTGLMRDINLLKFFEKLGNQKAYKFVKNRKDMLEQEFKEFKEHKG